jgi:predicted ATPase
LLERPDVSVPDTLQGVLMARVDRLPEDHKRLLQTASVLGREFPADPFDGRLGSPGNPGLLLADLRHWEFLHEEPTAEDSLYFFRHVLTQEAVYQTLLTNRRRSLRARLSTEYSG